MESKVFLVNMDETKGVVGSGIVVSGLVLCGRKVLGET